MFYLVLHFLLFLEVYEDFEGFRILFTIATIRATIIGISLSPFFAIAEYIRSSRSVTHVVVLIFV